MEQTKILDMENTEFLGNDGGKSCSGANTGEAAGPEMHPSSGWECLGTWFPFCTWEVFPAHLHCLLKVFRAPKGTLWISGLGNVVLADVWVNKALEPVLSLQQVFQSHGIRS